MPQQLSTVLPPGQDYLKPVASVAAAQVVCKAMEADTPSAHAVLLVGAATVGGVFGGAATPRETRWVGLAVGALFGTALAAYGLGLIAPRAAASDGVAAHRAPEPQRALPKAGRIVVVEVGTPGMSW